MLHPPPPWSYVWCSFVRALEGTTAEKRNAAGESPILLFQYVVSYSLNFFLHLLRSKETKICSKRYRYLENHKSLCFTRTAERICFCDVRFILQFREEIFARRYRVNNSLYMREKSFNFEWFSRYSTFPVGLYSKKFRELRILNRVHWKKN